MTCSIWPGSTTTVPRSRPRLDAQLDVLADQAAEHRLHREHRRAEIEQLRRQDLLAAEREQLARELGGALAGAIDLLDVLGEPARRLAGRAGAARCS